MIKKIFIFVLICCATGTISAQTEDFVNLKTIRIGIVVDGEWDRNEDVIKLLIKEVKDALAQQAEIVFPKDKILIGDWTQPTASRLIDALLDDENVDIVIGFGVMASYDLAKRQSLSKPVIAPIIVDENHKYFPYKNGASGIKNLSYLIYPGTYERDLNLFKELVPFKKLAIIHNKRYMESLPYLTNEDETISRNFGVQIVNIGIDFDANVDETLNSIPQDVDAVYIDVLPMPTQKFNELADGLIKRRLPSFSYLGEFDVQHGIMAAANPDIFPRLVRRIALHIQRIASGEDAGTLNVSFNAAKRLFINLKTAFGVGVSPKWSTMLEAELIEIDSAKFRGAQNFNLPSAIKRIAESNLDVLAKIEEVAAENKNVAIARGNLLPKIDFNTTGLQIDNDRALAGYQPDKRASFDFSLTQVLFSEPAYANLGIQSSLYDAKKNELEVLRQNTITDGSKIYLNYLRAKKMFYILLDNLKLMRSNYEIALNRKNIGAAGPEEPLRWEVEIANLRKTAMEVQAQMNQALIALKQVLNIPLVYLINIEDVSLDDPSFAFSDKRLLGYLEDPVSFDLLTDFLTNRGVAQSKEIKQLNSLIEAQERNLTSISNSNFLPSLALFAGYTRTFYKTAIKQPFALTSLPPLPSSIPVEFPQYLGQLFSSISTPLPNDNDWQIGLQLSLNLFNGFATKSSEQQADYFLNQLTIQKKSVEEKIAMRVRVEMENVKSAYFGIQQSRLEVDAADKTLKLVSDAYTSGALSILNLIDAQGSSLRAQQVAANALYDFYIDYMQLQRAVGQFDVLMTREEKDEFMTSMDEFMNQVKKR